MIMSGMKKKFEIAKGKWFEELLCVFWAYRTTLWKAIGVRLPTIRSETYDNEHNTKVLAQDINLDKERWENALIRMASYQKQLAKIYNQKV